MEATIKIAYVNSPQQGRKNGSVKTDMGEFYGVPPSMLSQFSQGASYVVDYGTRDYNGKTYRDVKNVIRMVSAPTPAGGSNSYRQTDDATAERIFVCGGLNSALQAGQVNIGDTAGLFNAVQNMRETWARTFGNKGGAAGARQGTQSVPHDDDMSDSIPF